MYQRGSESLKIGINGLEIKTQEKDCIIADAKGIILFLRTFYMYT